MDGITCHMPYANMPSSPSSGLSLLHFGIALLAGRGWENCVSLPLPSPPFYFVLFVTSECTFFFVYGR